MCRLLAIRAEHPVKIDRAFAGLSALSREHKDGWGLCRFDEDAPLVERSLEPAHQCGRFAHLGSAVTTRHLLAHIRLASVGGVNERNAHPFVAGAWAFMHNGTVQRFQHHLPEVEAKIAPHWRRMVKGETDSEHCFALFLTHLDALPRPTLDDVARALARTMAEVAQVCDVDPQEKPSALNFVASNGRLLVASRRGRSLFHGQENGVRVIASERLWAGPDWQEVPENGLVGIDQRLGVQTWTVDSLLSR